MESTRSMIVKSAKITVNSQYFASNVVKADGVPYNLQFSVFCNAQVNQRKRISTIEIS